MRLDNLSKWEKVDSSGVLALQGEGERPVVLYVNTAQKTLVHCVIADESGKEPRPILLGVVEGQDEIRFTPWGPCEVWFTTDDEVWFHTLDGASGAVEVPEQVSFTRLEERRVTNPDLALMLFKARQNEMRRNEQLEADRAAMAAMMERLKAATERAEASASGSESSGGANTTVAGGTGGGDGAAAGGAAGEAAGVPANGTA